jgi:hypothetical protein
MMRSWMQLARRSVGGGTGPELRLILWAASDPIGGGVPLDEYDTYAPQVWELLRSGASEDDVAAHLRSHRERSIETGGHEHDIRAA